MDTAECEHDDKQDYVCYIVSSHAAPVHMNIEKHCPKEGPPSA